MTEPSSERLAVALQEAGAPTEMIEKARKDFYHDFKSPLALPEHVLYQEALLHGLASICEGVLQGKWDATKEESDAWARSADGQAAMRQLLEGK